jgi:hypothetical protein
VDSSSQEPRLEAINIPGRSLGTTGKDYLSRTPPLVVNRVDCEIHDVPWAAFDRINIGNSRTKKRLNTKRRPKVLNIKKENAKQVVFM